MAVPASRSAAAAVAGEAPEAAHRATHLEQRLVVLMGARLGLSLLSLALALALDGVGGDIAIRGLYHTVAFAFLATIVHGLVLRKIRRTQLFAALNIATDIAIVTCLVQFSGGADSVFTFLYVIVAVYGAMLFARRGAIACACLGAAAYGGVLLAGHEGWVAVGLDGVSAPSAVLFTLWTVHATALVLAAALGSVLTSDLQRTGEALHRRTSDLQHLQSLHRRTVESLMSGLLTTDETGAITSFNPEAERITGLAAAEALGRPVAQVLPDMQSLLTRGEERGAARPRMRRPYRNRRGEELHLGLAAYVLRDAERANGHVVIFQDVTEVVEMERELRRSERLAAVGQLSASIAHEIRNPLAAISGSIQMLSRRVETMEPGGEAGQLMEIVLRETDRLDRLVTDFLHYARPGPLRRETLRVAELVNEVARMFEASRPQAVRVELDVPAGLTVSADAARLRQVLWNLVINATEAMPEGGRLRISARPASEPEPQGGSREGRKEAAEKSGGAEIAVSDQGTGIAPEVMDRIFDPFFTTKREGSGLGLATVHRIVEEHGGSIRLESAPGRGTTVRLRLPAEGEPA